MKSAICLFFLPVLALSGCVSWHESSKYNLSEGIYHTKYSEIPSKNVYIIYYGDSLQLYKLPDKLPSNLRLEDFSSEMLLLPVNKTAFSGKKYIFSQNSFDIDFVTIPFKIRFANQYLPQQLNTNFNGSLYLGYRMDRFKLNYRQNRVGIFKKDLNHLGFSFGIFGGLGATSVNPSVTNNGIQTEYEGIISGKGIAGIIGINNLTFGIGAGIDHLHDPNRVYWMYQGKPWVGLMLGLNVN